MPMMAAEKAKISNESVGMSSLKRYSRNRWCYRAFAIVSYPSVAAFFSIEWEDKNTIYIYI